MDGKTPSDAEDALLRARRQITFSLPSDLIEKEAQHQEANTVVRAHMARGLHLTTDFIDEQVAFIRAKFGILSELTVSDE